MLHVGSNFNKVAELPRKKLIIVSLTTKIDSVQKFVEVGGVIEGQTVSDKISLFVVFQSFVL